MNTSPNYNTINVFKFDKLQIKYSKFPKDECILYYTITDESTRTKQYV